MGMPFKVIQISKLYNFVLQNLYPVFALMKVTEVANFKRGGGENHFLKTTEIHKTKTKARAKMHIENLK